jgi:hypothetical protein
MPKDDSIMVTPSTCHHAGNKKKMNTIKQLGKNDYVRQRLFSIA